jgi:hypothetical protein
MCKIARCTFVPSNVGTASQDVPSKALVTFLLLSVPTDLASVQLERVVGVLVESWMSNEKDTPVPVANRSHILVDEWEWGAAEG